MPVTTPVVSSLAGAVRAYFEGLFPKGYFSSRYIDARAGISRRRRFRPLTESQITANNTPLLSIKVDPTADPSDFLAGDDWSQGNAFLNDPLRLCRVIVDDTAGRFLGAHFERMVCRFGVTITVNTDLQAHDVTLYLRRVVPVARRTFLNELNISTELPQDVMRALWADLGLGDGSDPGDYETFYRYLATRTGGRIERVLNSATGRLMFSYRYSANPVMTISGPPSFSVNRDGVVVKSAAVELQLELDLPIPMSYAYRQDGPAALPSAAPPDFGVTGFSVFFGTTLPAQPPEMTEDGLKLAFRTALATGPLDPAAPRQVDVTPVASHVPAVVRQYIDTLRLLPDSDQHLRAELWMDGERLPSTEFSFDWRTLDLAITLPRPSYQYDLCLYCDAAGLLDEFPTSGTRKPTPDPLISLPK